MIRTFGILTIVVMFAFMPLVASARQGFPQPPATPVPGQAPVGVLAEFDLDELPTPHTEVWFLRMELDAAGSVAMGEQVGPTMIYVESGELTLLADGSANTGADTATPADNAGKVLATGSSMLIESGSYIEIRNNNDAPTNFLVLAMFAAEMENMNQEPQPEPVGLKQGGIAVGTAEFMPFPAHVTIERLVLKPGETLEPAVRTSDEEEFPGPMAMELGAIETGSADVTLNFVSSSNLTWPGMLRGEMTGPNMTPLSATVPLGTGDAYSFFGSTVTWTVVGNEPLTILRVVILPEMFME